MRTSRDIEDVLIIWKQNVIFVSISKILVCTFCFIPVVELFLKNSRWQGDGGRIIFATKWSFCSVSRIMHVMPEKHVYPFFLKKYEISVILIRHKLFSHSSFVPFTNLTLIVGEPLCYHGSDPTSIL